MPTLLALDRVLKRPTTAVEQLGRYELLGRLGAGGMAEVFVARCGEVAGMQSLVAVKRILPHLAEDEAFVALFRREAQISLRLRHRAIARVVEVGRAGNAWFLAMELVPGESLAHVLRAERERGVAVDPRLVAWVGAEIASALHHAHGLADGGVPLHVIHRDVSPQNLLLGFDGAAKLIDFGVARCARLSDTTRTGTVRGKLAYASPEQLGARPLDGRSDLFSLAIVLHEWLAGAPLFACDSDAATVLAVQAAEIPPLARAPRLGAVLARALARKPELRFPDGEALAEALLDAVGGRPPAPERLIVAHLGALFPDRQVRWQAIVSGRAVDLDAVVPAAGGGGTLRGTPVLVPTPLAPPPPSPSTPSVSVSVSASASAWPSASPPSSNTRTPGGVTLARRRVRRRAALLIAAAAGLGSLFVGWARRDHAATALADVPGIAEARPTATSAADQARAGRRDESAPRSEAAAAPDAASPSSPAASWVASPPHRHLRRAVAAAARPSSAAAPARAATAARAVPAGARAPAAAARRAIVDELEPSPYAAP